MYDFVRANKDHPQIVNSRVRSEELKQSDLLFVKLGIEEADVEPSIRRLNMTKDDDYKKIVQVWQTNSEKFLREKA